MTRPIIDKLFLHRMTVRQGEEWGRESKKERGGGTIWLDEWKPPPHTHPIPTRPEETGVYLSDSIKSSALWRTKLPAPRHALTAIIRSWTLSQSQWSPPTPPTAPPFSLFAHFYSSFCALKNWEAHHFSLCVCVCMCHSLMLDGEDNAYKRDTAVKKKQPFFFLGGGGVWGYVCFSTASHSLMKRVQPQCCVTLSHNKPSLFLTLALIIVCTKCVFFRHWK